MTDRRRRSALFLPASNARAIAKARTLDCDVVILDLEDSVAPEAKAAARGQAVEAIAQGGFGHREVVVRVNGRDTPWGLQDCRALTGVAGVFLVPKLGGGEDLRGWREAVGPGAALWAMIETCDAMLRLSQIVDAAPAAGLSCLVAGTNDLAREMRCVPGPDRAPLLPHLVQIVTAARAGGMAVLDGVCNAIDAPARFASECAQAAMFGFDGKTLIHPDQIAAANAAFAPTAEQLLWARKVIAAFALPENDTQGALRIDGVMIERLHLEEAERLVAFTAP